jgi:hypothetical protein
MIEDRYLERERLRQEQAAEQRRLREEEAALASAIAQIAERVAADDSNEQRYIF